MPPKAHKPPENYHLHRYFGKFMQQIYIIIIWFLVWNPYLKTNVFVQGSKQKSKQKSQVIFYISFQKVKYYPNLCESHFYRYINLNLCGFEQHNFLSGPKKTVGVLFRYLQWANPGLILYYLCYFDFFQYKQHIGCVEFLVFKSHPS